MIDNNMIEIVLITSNLAGKSQYFKKLIMIKIPINPSIITFISPAHHKIPNNNAISIAEDKSSFKSLKNLTI